MSASQQYDVLGNLVNTTDPGSHVTQMLTKRTADPAGDIYVDTQYDSKGRKSQVSNPYRTGDTVAWTTGRTLPAPHG